MAIADYVKTCSKNVAGNSTLWLTEAENISSVTIVTGEITVITMKTGKEWQPYDNDLDSLIRSQEGSGNGNNISYTHKIEAKFSKLSPALNTARTALADASVCGILALVKDSNGVWWLVGYNPSDLTKRALKLMTDSDTSGGAPDDEEGGKASIVLESKSGYLDIPVKSTSTVAVGGIST